MHKYLAVIPAREGSKRIPDKNLLSVGDRSMIQRSADSVRESEIYKNGEVRLVCTTDSDRAKALAVSAGIELVDPPWWFNTTDRSLNETLEYLYGSLGGEIAMLVTPTAPFRRGHIYDQVAEAFERRPDAQVAMSLVQTPYRIEWTLRKNGNGLFTYSEFPEGTPIEHPVATYTHDGQVWAIRTPELARAKTITQIPSLTGVMAVWPESLDLDWPPDLEMAQYIALMTGL